MPSDALLDTRQLETFYKQLRKIEPESAKAFASELKQGGEAVRLDASRRAWSESSRIPGSIRSLGSGLSVKVRAGSAKAPHAAAFEKGEFRHPVFGNRDVWVQQKTTPYLAPALDAKAGRVATDVLAAIDRLFDKFL